MRYSRANLWTPPWAGYLLRNICVTNDHGYVLFVLIIIWSFPHLWRIIELANRLARRVSHVKQELPALPDILSSPPVFSRLCVAGSLVICVVFCRSLFVRLRFKASDYPFRIYNLFLYGISGWKCALNLISMFLLMKLET
jgi:hypothetical protein